jgi:Protein of unknown function (DUF4229)
VSREVRHHRHPVLVYSLLRAGLFAVALGLLYLAGARGVLLLAMALLVSGLASLWLLMRQRDAVSAAVVERSRRARARLDEAAAAEDADVNPAEGDGTHPASPSAPER